MGFEITKYIKRAMEVNERIELFFADYDFRKNNYSFEISRFPKYITKAIFDEYTLDINKLAKELKISLKDTDAIDKVEDYSKRRALKEYLEIESTYIEIKSKAKPTSLYQFTAKLREYLEENITPSAYIYRYDNRTDSYTPYLLREIKYTPKDSYSDYAFTTIELVYNDKNETQRMEIEINTDNFRTSKRDVKTLLEMKNIHVEQPQYLEEYKKGLEDFKEKETWQNSQILYNGIKYINDHLFHKTNLENSSNTSSRNRKSISGLNISVSSSFSTNEDGSNEIPYHFNIYAFNLKTHQFEWLNAKSIEKYEYNPLIKQKLVLPQNHKDLIEILLSSDLKELGCDIIAGKAQGTTILVKGTTGLGKTLTAEVYSEKKKLPLYSVHAGDLGTKGEEIETKLRVCFERAERWGCILLIDEADVYIRRRDNDVNHNAIVATLLRTLEYYNGILFMTTNRIDDVDSAIESRATAILTYTMPDASEITKLWELYTQQYNIKVSDEVIEELTKEMQYAGRDIRNICILVSRYMQSKNIDKAQFKEFKLCATFRGLYVIGSKQEKEK